jgi:hypothetical protein
MDIRAQSFWNAGDDGNAASTAEPTLWLSENTAVCYRLRQSSSGECRVRACASRRWTGRAPVEGSMQAGARFRIVAVAAALGACLAAHAGAEEIAVGNYGIAANGMPFAVALEMKLYQAEGANVTGIISSQGGGTATCWLRLRGA